MSGTPMDLFVGLSSVLTGIAPDKLAPGLDPVDIKQAYFDFAQAKGGATFAQLLQIFDQNQTQPPATIANIVFSQSGAAVCYLARAIMLMWYLGSWYDPGYLQSLNTADPQPPNVAVISPAAYTSGWAWSVAQAHPMGYSNFRFGYWATQPPSLADFIGQQAQGAAGGDQ